MLRKRFPDLGVPVVDDELSGPFLEYNASNSAFPPPGPDDLLGSEPAWKPRFHILLQAHPLQVSRRGGEHVAGHGGDCSGGGGGHDRGGRVPPEGGGIRGRPNPRQGEGLRVRGDLVGEGERGEGGGEGGKGDRHWSPCLLSLL